MVVFPPCKINLGLRVIDKRPDGYHDLETCFYPVPWTDILEVIPSTSFLFTSSGRDIPGDPAANLCVRAYHLLKKDFEISPVRIHLHKVVPTGAGLGGGSADASHILRMLNEMFDLRLSQEKLTGYAAQLGSDCAFFLHDTPKLGTGRGEILEDTSCSLKGKFLVLIKPDEHISTAEAYESIHPERPSIALREILEHKPLKQWKDVLKNDFEESVFKKCPLIEAAKEKLYSLGAIYSAMSGSGAAVFGIFDSPVEVPAGFKDTWSGVINQ